MKFSLFLLCCLSISYSAALADSCHSCCSNPDATLFCIHSDENRVCTDGCACCHPNSSVQEIKGKAGYFHCCPLGSNAWLNGSSADCCETEVYELANEYEILDEDPNGTVIPEKCAQWQEKQKQKYLYCCPSGKTLTKLTSVNISEGSGCGSFLLSYSTYKCCSNPAQTTYQCLGKLDSSCMYAGGNEKTCCESGATVLMDQTCS